MAEAPDLGIFFSTPSFAVHQAMLPPKHIPNLSTCFFPTCTSIVQASVIFSLNCPLRVYLFLSSTIPYNTILSPFSTRASLKSQYKSDRNFPLPEISVYCTILRTKPYLSRPQSPVCPSPAPAPSPLSIPPVY